MTLTMPTETETQQIEQTLIHSIQEYEHIAIFLQKIDDEIGTASPAQLLEYNDSLTDLQGHATQTDQVLLAHLSAHSEQTETIRALIEKRKRIIRDILTFNDGITAKASGVKSHIAFELGKLRNGISAMNGYKQMQNNLGQIVNRSS